MESIFPPFDFGWPCNPIWSVECGREDTTGLPSIVLQVLSCSFYFHPLRSQPVCKEILLEKPCGEKVGSRFSHPSWVPDIWMKPSWILQLEPNWSSQCHLEQKVSCPHKAQLHCRFVSKWMLVVLSHYILKRLVMQQQTTETEGQEGFLEEVLLKVLQVET